MKGIQGEDGAVQVETQNVVVAENGVSHDKAFLYSL